MNGRRRWLTIPLLAGAAGLAALDHAGAFGTRADDRLRYDRADARVIRVWDGDTLEVDLPDGRAATTRVRLRGVDAPEVAHSPGGHDDPDGRRAESFLRARLSGKLVRLILDPHRPTRDSQGRLLAYVYEGDHDSMVNEELIVRGLARAEDRPDHVLRLRFAEVARRAGRRGDGAESRPRE
jgi:endonuclease YncB( thermonuclease family)